MLDIERILQTRIPDIARVYGGVRGRALSSRKQAYASTYYSLITSS